MPFTHIYLLANALCIGLIGLCYLFSPNLLLALYEINLTNVSMDNMMRSTYGGLFVVAAIGFSLGVFDTRKLLSSLTLTAWFMGGLALGRLFSFLLSGAPHPAVYSLFAYEVAALLLGLWLKRRVVQGGS